MLTKSDIRKLISGLYDSRSTLLQKLSDEESLILAGVIDSIGIIRLISQLEEEYKIILPMETLNRANFETIENIHSLVLPLLSSA